MHVHAMSMKHAAGLLSLSMVPLPTLSQPGACRSPQALIVHADPATSHVSMTSSHIPGNFEMTQQGMNRPLLQQAGEALCLLWMLHEVASLVRWQCCALGELRLDDGHEPGQSTSGRRHMRHTHLLISSGPEEKGKFDIALRSGPQASLVEQNANRPAFGCAWGHEGTQSWLQVPIPDAALAQGMSR